jgi:hypothetical protein
MVGAFDCMGCAYCAQSVERRARFAEVREHRKVKAEDANAKRETVPPVSEERPRERDAFEQEMDRMDLAAALCWA